MNLADLLASSKQLKLGRTVRWLDEITPFRSVALMADGYAGGVYPGPVSPLVLALPGRVRGRNGFTVMKIV